MMKRPSRNENEDDLLRQQKDFLKEKGLGNVSDPCQEDIKVVEPVLEQNFGLVGDIVERKHGELTFKLPEKIDSGFPQVFKVDPRSHKKGSLFAQRFSSKCESGTNKALAGESHDVKREDVPSDVHQENVTKLQSMTSEEILEEKAALEKSLDPKLLEFLKSRGKGKKSADTTSVLEVTPEESTKVNLEMLIDKEWMEMDTVEPEKLQWIGEIPDAKALEKDQPYSARFDFTGDLLPFKTDIDVRASLHHHGNEPSRPGYTIDELYQLARSTVLQQRILALNTLANIVRKAKLGYYDGCFDDSLLRKFVETDLIFILRFAMDDRATTSAAVHCLHQLFCNRSDEVGLDRLLNVDDEIVEPYLFVHLELDKDVVESELQDHQLLSQDMIRGVLRTDLLVRFCYVLKEFAPDRVAVGRMFEIMIRICRHSPEACAEVYNTPGLVGFIFETTNSPEPFTQGLKLIRVLACSSLAIAEDFAKSYSFEFMLIIIDMDAPAFKLKLECLALWKCFIAKRLLLDKFESFTPCLLRLLWFYVEKVDIEHGRFDFELFAAIVSLVNSVTLSKTVVDLRNFTVIIQTCIEKWLTQFKRKTIRNFSLAKALGSAFRFLILKYSLQSVTKDDVVFLEKLSPILVTFLTYETFSEMSSALQTYSHVINYDEPDRDPANLPSLTSVYCGGSDFLKIVQDQSALPLLLSLSKFLLNMYEISHAFKYILELFARIVKHPCSAILNSSPVSSWFARYEVKFLALACAVLGHHDESLALDLAFKCVSHFRTDDLSAVHALIPIFSSSSLPDLTEFYIVSLCHVSEFPLYHCENIAKEWVFSPIQEHPGKVLDFASSILERNPKLLHHLSPTKIYYKLCLVFLNENNVFDSNIKPKLQTCFEFVLWNFEKLDLNIRVTEGKTFYELYIDLVTQYAAISYGDELFAKFVTLPLAQRFSVSFRKLLWSEYMHALRVITLPAQIESFISIDKFIRPIERDESLLVVYLNAIAKGVLMPKRNGFIYSVAKENVRNYLNLPDCDDRLAAVLRNRINNLTDIELKTDLLSRN